MKRAVAFAPWLFAAGAVALVLAALSGGLTSAATNLWIVIGGGFACYVGASVNRLPWVIVAAVAIGGLRIATLPAHGSFSPIHEASIASDLISVAAGVALALVLTIALRSRRGRLDVRDMIDLITVVTSSALATWVLFTSRLIDLDGMDPFAAISHTLYVPLAAILFWFILDLLFTGLRSNRTMQFITGAAVLNLIAAVVSSVADVGMASISGNVALGLYGAAFLLLCAGLSHRDAPATMMLDAPDEERGAFTPLRLVLNGTSLLLLGGLVAAVQPTSTLDSVVRTIAVLIGVTSVVTRLVLAVRSHESAHHELASRVDRDELTGLPTRARFVRVVDEVLEETWRSEFEPTIVQLNLDRFKNINDSLGHYEANRVLVAVAERLTDATEAFGGTFARIGGDDFAVIDATTRSSAEAMARLDVMRKSLDEPVQLGESTVFVTASFGVAVAPRNRTVSAEELLRRADIATHRAKGTGRSSVAMFDDSMQSHLAHRMDVEHALHGAIGRQEMRLYHQPIVDIATGEVSGFESLIRWQRDGEIVPPGDFIPIAEDTGMIGQLGEWALNEALAELRRWIDDGIVAPTTTISVNVSPKQIADPGFSDLVRRALDAAGVPPELLWLEMTESMMLDEPELAESTLRMVRDMGVRIALDDFGTGYSSLSLLQNFPIQRIKIDRAFVTGIAEPGNDRSLVRTVIALAQSMDLDLVAEGVETIQQLRALSEFGCHRAQGYLISRPVPADAMRSTMVALDALSSLSLFGDEGTLAHAASIAAEHAPAQAVGATAGAGVSSMPISAAATSRPLGLPVH